MTKNQFYVIPERHLLILTRIFQFIGMPLSNVQIFRELDREENDVKDSIV